MTFSYAHPAAIAESTNSDLPPPRVTVTEHHISEVMNEGDTRANSSVLLHQPVKSALPGLTDDQVNVSLSVIPIAAHGQHSINSREERDRADRADIHSSRRLHERELAVNETETVTNSTLIMANITRVHQIRSTHTPAFNESSGERDEDRETEGSFNSTVIHTDDPGQKQQ